MHRVDDGYLLLDRWVDRGPLSWGANLPISPGVERVLAERIAAIGDDTARAGAAAGFDRLRAARDEVAAAAGDPDRLAAALAGLNAEFTAVTGRPATRHRGQMYAGRTVCYEDSARDLEFRLGAPVLDALAAPLAVVLQAARWLTAEIGAGVTALLAELHDELAADGPVRLADIWSLAQGTLVAPHGPFATAAADLTAAVGPAVRPAGPAGRLRRTAAVRRGPGRAGARRLPRRPAGLAVGPAAQPRRADRRRLAAGVGAGGVPAGPRRAAPWPRSRSTARSSACSTPTRRRCGRISTPISARARLRVLWPESFPGVPPAPPRSDRADRP